MYILTVLLTVMTTDVGPLKHIVMTLLVCHTNPHIILRKCNKKYDVVGKCHILFVLSLCIISGRKCGPTVCGKDGEMNKKINK